MDDGMQVLVGPVTTGPALSVSTLVNEDRTFMLTPSASSLDVVDGKDNVFQLCFTDPNQGKGSATYIAANMPEAKIAVIYRNDDTYSTGIYETFVAECENQNLDVVYEGAFTGEGASDFSVQLTGAQSAGADVVFLPIYYQPASIIFAQADAMGYEPTFFGVDGMDGILTMPNFDMSLAEGVMVLTPFSADATDELTVSFVTKYSEQFGETPNQFAADGYDCVYALKQALEAADANPEMTNEELCDAPRRAVHLHELRRPDRLRPHLGRRRHRQQAADGGRHPRRRVRQRRERLSTIPRGGRSEIRPPCGVCGDAGPPRPGICRRKQRTR